MKISDEFQTFLQTGKNSELSAKGIFPEEQIKHSTVLPLFTFPVRIRHSDLIEICNTLTMWYIVYNELNS